MIKLDFFGGSHGHFLEYVSNVYILKTAPSESNIYSHTGAVHTPSRTYLENRIIVCDHYSMKSPCPFTDTEPVIRIVVDSADDRSLFIFSTNVVYRAGDCGYKWHINQLPADLSVSRSAIRNVFFSRFNERELYSMIPEFVKLEQAALEFPFSAFYNYTTLCDELLKLANYLGTSFNQTDGLYYLWKTFIEKNQGMTSFNKCVKIIDCLSSNEVYDFGELTEIEEAWVNYCIFKSYGVFSEGLHIVEKYPTTTQGIKSLLYKK